MFTLCTATLLILKKQQHKSKITQDDQTFRNISIIHLELKKHKIVPLLSHIILALKQPVACNRVRAKNPTSAYLFLFLLYSRGNNPGLKPLFTPRKPGKTLRRHISTVCQESSQLV